MRWGVGTRRGGGRSCGIIADTFSASATSQRKFSSQMDLNTTKSILSQYCMDDDIPAVLAPPRKAIAYASKVPPKQVSPHVGFYKSFGRPIAKVFLGATFTYQVTYWLWTKLEIDEIKRDKAGMGVNTALFHVDNIRGS
ncbi:hypothetical protein MMC18_009671 [Xylographa bjoerkii]|nr:hypothetical protein [Xylographa bjoerkii]